MKYLPEMRVEQEQQQHQQGGVQGSGGHNAPQMTPQQLFDVYNKNLPTTLGTTVGQAGTTANTLAGAAAGANPTYTASGLQQLQQFAPGYQQAGANIAKQQAKSQVDLLKGAGGQAATAGQELTNNLNPALAAANRGAVAGVNSINLNGLSPGEQNSVERSLNQSNYATGRLGIDNATNAVSNAMNFGGAFNSKLGLLNQAVGSAVNAGNASNAAFNPYAAATNASNIGNNFGLSTFNPTQANGTITAPLTFGSSIFAPTSSNASSQVGKSSSQGVSGGICFLTTACCEYKGLADNCEELTVLRNFRDRFVPKFLVEEYYELSKTFKNRLTKSTLDYIYKTVRECVDDIKRGANESALNKYTNMVTNVKEQL